MHPVNDSGIGRNVLFPESVPVGVVSFFTSPYDDWGRRPFLNFAGLDSVAAQPIPSLVAAADQRLLERCIVGDTEAWRAFLQRFGGLFAYVAGRTAERRGAALSDAEREDIVANVVLECLKNDAAVLRAFAGRASLSSYLTVIARRVTVRHLVRELEAFRAAVAHDRPPPSAMPSAQPTDDREQVAALLGRLEADEATLVRLHHLESRSYGEISAITGLPLGSIGPALSRARTKLRAMME
jgi:RNA polymerase sigma-70 factor (ECF subfamily)